MTQCPNPQCHLNNISPKIVVVLEADGTTYEEVWHQSSAQREVERQGKKVRRKTDFRQCDLLERRNGYMGEEFLLDAVHRNEWPSAL